MLPSDVLFPLLMERLEEILDLLHERDIGYWFDWGTLLGYQRHANVIPWDYDVDLCFLKPDYDRVRALFAERGGRIGALGLEPDYYGEPESCAFIPIDEDPEKWHGIDLVAYEVRDGRVWTLMSPKLVASYAGSYDVPEGWIFPQGRGHFLGRRVRTLRDADAHLTHRFGDWRKYPDDQKPSAITAPPFCEGMPLPAPPVGARPFGATSELAPGAVWQKRSTGIDTIWIVSPEDVAALEARGVARAMLDGKSFTALVHLADRFLWGRVIVVSLAEGDAIEIPAGAWVGAPRVARTTS
jgi:hypothetical protein